MASRFLVLNALQVIRGKIEREGEKGMRGERERERKREGGGEGERGRERPCLR